MRLDDARVLPAARAALLGLEKVLATSSLEPKLRELIKLRASQINGCAVCVDIHTKDARAIGEEEQRLYLVAVWREAPCFSERERAALAWSEALTLLPTEGASDELFEGLAAVFSAEEIVALTHTIALINTWNRLSIALRRPVGEYVSRRRLASR